MGQTLQIAQKGSDYSFVKDTLCRLECREFFVLAGKAYFIDASRKKQSVVSLEWGRDITFFFLREELHIRNTSGSDGGSEPADEISGKGDDL